MQKEQILILENSITRLLRRGASKQLLNIIKLGELDAERLSVAPSRGYNVSDDGVPMAGSGNHTAKHALCQLA